jgi:hypothetical protein
MSQPNPKWVALYIAPLELARHWDVPEWIAEQIVRGVLQGSECFVRGRGPDRILRDISGKISATLSSSVLISAVFSDVEIEWNDFVTHGRKLVPCEWENVVSAAIERHAEANKTRREAVQSHARPGPTPGTVRHYDAADIALFPELERLMREGHSLSAAALKLADDGKIAGPRTTTPASKAKRLAKLHKLHQSKSRESGS